MSSENRLPIALTIAGFDPSGGGGVIADARTFTAFNCLPAAVVTSITFQNDKAVFGAEHVSADTIRRQVMAVVEGGLIGGVKTGMLPTRAAVREVVRLLRDTNLPAPIVDPVLRSTSGYSLIKEDAIGELLSELVPLARLVTPNIPEAERITGLRLRDVEGMQQAAEMIRAKGARAVLIKGGHLPNESAASAKQEAIDLLDNEGKVIIFRGDWIPDVRLRGTGCMLSAGIAACLAKGKSLEESISAAKSFVAGAIKQASHIRERAN
jgi:hydroxymethylpyrimidine kinase/phosphomethylpyrimidine kinase